MRYSWRALLSVGVAVSALGCSDYLSGPGISTDPNNPSQLTRPGPLYVGIQAALAPQREGQVARDAMETMQQIAGIARQQLSIDHYLETPGGTDTFFGAVYGSSNVATGGGGLLATSDDNLRQRPLAVKRAMRAIFKSTDMCAADPRFVARRLVDGGFTDRYDEAVELLSAVPYGKWREYDPEDTLRFYALQLHDLGLIKTSPNKIVAEGTDWLHKLLQKIERGEGQMRDLDLLASISGNIGGKTLCAFGDAAVTPVLTTLKHFRGEYEAHIREGRCTLMAEWRAHQAVGAH